VAILVVSLGIVNAGALFGAPISSSRVVAPQDQLPNDSVHMKSLKPPAVDAGSAAAVPHMSSPAIWMVKAPSRLALVEDSKVPVMIVAGGRRLERLHIAAAVFQDPATNALLPATQWQLCRVGESICRDTFDIGPQASSVTLRVSGGVRNAGAFAGTVWLAADSSGDPKPVDMTVYATRRTWQVWGATLIVVGVALSWFTTVVVRRLISRADAELPASALRASLSNLQTEATTATSITQVHLPAIANRITNALELLTPRHIAEQGWLPSAIANPFDPNADFNSEYAKTLQRLSDGAGALTVIMFAVDYVVAMWPASAHQPELTAGLLALDGAALVSTTAIDAKARVDPVLVSLDAKLNPPPQLTMQAAMAATTAPPTAQLPTVREIRLQVQRAGIWVWTLWLLLTSVIGVMVLVAPRYDFGTGIDYFKCFLWGFGIPAAGQQLSQVTPSTLTTNLSLKIPS
jgi:hypothetical protein